VQRCKNCENWIFGITDNNENNVNFIKCITSLITSAFESGNIKYNKITFVSNKEAEMIKYYRNTFLSLKVSFSNEIYDFCKINNINYDIISEISCEDKRIGKSHINVPDHDGKRGFGGTCFPKDTAALLCEYKKLGLKSYIINAAVERNNKIDRPEKDWENNVGRAFIH
jgi:UDP-glucose 6-dehydrogenase